MNTSTLHAYREEKIDYLPAKTLYVSTTVTVTIYILHNIIIVELYLHSAFLDYSIQCARVMLHNLETKLDMQFFLLVISKAKEMSF